MKLLRQYKRRRFLLWGGIFIGGILSVFIAGYVLFFEVVYANHVFPGVYVEGVSAEGMTYQELSQRLTRFERGLKQGFSFAFTDTQGQTYHYSQKKQQSKHYEEYCQT